MTPVTAEPDLSLDSDTPVELTLEQQLSKLSRTELMAECRNRSLPITGSTTALIARIVRFEENGGILQDDPLTDAPQVVVAAVVPPPVVAAQAPAGEVASAPAGPAPATPPARQKTGFFEKTNTFRAEIPIGPRTIDDETHFACIKGTHDAAAEAGFTTRGAPWAGHRVGYSTFQGMRSAIYEVSVRGRIDEEE